MGTYPHENGMYGLAHRGHALNDPGQTFVHLLRANGYETAMAGAMHVCEETRINELGFDRLLGASHLDPHHLGAESSAVEFIKGEPTKPFFLSVGFHETHRVFPDSTGIIDPDYVRGPSPLPDSPETRKDMADYIHMAGILDRKIGAVIDALKAQNIYDNTLIICTTDHGIPFPKMKCNLTDHGVGVMQVIKLPQDQVALSSPKCVEAAVSHLDIYPTLCDLLDLPRPERLRGRSMMSLMRGETDQLHETLFFEVNQHAETEPMRAVRSQRWKYIRRYNENLIPVSKNIDPGASKNHLQEFGLLEQRHDREAIFDLTLDPGEANNLLHAQPDHPQLEILREELLKWQQATSDPLLESSSNPS